MQHETRSTNSGSLYTRSSATGPQKDLQTDVSDFTPSHHFLPLDDGQIRILAVTVQDDDVENMVLSLVPVHLSGGREPSFKDTGMDYTAISYAWDPDINDQDTLQVVCTSSVGDQHYLSFHPDGTEHTISIPYSQFWMLVDALNIVRQGAGCNEKDRIWTRFFWIDQICINQSDDAEKSRQVRMMHDIYYCAKETLIYLGEEDEDTQSAFAIGRTFASLKGKRLDELPQLPHDDANAQPQINWPLLLPYIPVDAAMKAGEAFIISVLMCRWFDRTWIVQEIVASTQARLVCGEQSMLWSDLADACEFLKYHGDWSRWGGPERCYQTIDMECTRKSYLFWRFFISTETPEVELGDHRDSIMQTAGECARNLTFDRLFTLFTMRGVTDPRDTIFAMLNILSQFQGCNTGGLIDYSLSPRKVYLNATQLWARSSKLSRVSDELSKETVVGWSATEISFFDFVTDLEFNEKLKLPSWVPSWQGKSGVFYQNPNFCAAIRAKPYLIPPDPTLFDEEEIPLVVRGIRLFTISMMSPVMVDGKVSVSEHQNMLCRFVDPYPTTEETFARVYESTMKLEVSQLICEGKRPCKFWDAIRKQPATLPQNTVKSMTGSCTGPFQKLLPIPLQPGQCDSHTFRAFTKTRKLFVSQEGFLGLGPPCLEVGDIVCLLFGGAMLYVLRKLESDRYRFLGYCLVYGIMSGEALDSMPEDHIENFIVV
jgi:hypothetical protein